MPTSDNAFEDSKCKNYAILQWKLCLFFIYLLSLHWLTSMIEGGMAPSFVEFAVARMSSHERTGKLSMKFYFNKNIFKYIFRNIKITVIC